MIKGAEATPMHNIAIVESNLSLPFEYIFAGGLRAHEKYLENVGADGMQITPVASPLVRRIIRHGMAWESYDRNYVPVEARGPTGHFGRDLMSSLLDTPPPKQGYASEAMGRLIHSVHESFRDEANDNGLWALPFPRWPRSVRQMRFIQSATRRKLLAVMYPAFRQGKLVNYTDSEPYADEAEDARVYAPFLVNTVQPKPKDFKLWGLTESSSIKEIRDAMRRHGLPRISWDVVHGQAFKYPLDMCNLLAEDTESVHLRLRAIDEAKRNPVIAETTKQADKAFMKSPEAAARTLEGEMLLAIVKYWKRQPSHLQPKGGYSIVLEKPFRTDAWQARREDRATFETVRTMVANA